MTALRITPRRAEVLRAIAAGRVVRYRGWAKGEKTRDVWTMDDGEKKTITRACIELAGASPRLIYPDRSMGPSIYSGQLWALTPAGVKALADYDSKEA